MKRESRILLTKATDSVLLSIEHFNRPWDRGRYEAVLVFFDRAFELMLKAVIVYKGGRIREPRAKQTIGFDTCVRKCVSEMQVKCLTEEEALMIQIINSLRDAAQHYVVEISEQQLYMYTQAGMTLFSKILRDVFNRKLSDYFPERVLPISSNPPENLASIMDLEFKNIKSIATPGSRKSFEARAKLRSFAIIEASLSGSRSQPAEGELRKLVERVKKGEDWQSIFPGIRRLRLSTEDSDWNVALKITKSKGEPIYLVPEGTPGATIVAVKRVDELGYYSLNLSALSTKLKLTAPKTLALIKHLKMQEDSEFFKEFRMGSSYFKRYSVKALDKIKKELSNLDVDTIWKKYSRLGYIPKG
jgi:hypothetical protein